MSRLCFAITASLVLVPVAALAQQSGEASDSQDDKTPAAASPDTRPKAKLFSPFPLHVYSGDLWSRSALSGDWGGLRTTLDDNGISFKLEVTQVFQGNAHGGKSTKNGTRYGGSADYTLQLDTGRMGLWPGGLWTIRGETQFGSSVNFSKVGSIMSANYDALLPTPDGGKTTLSEVFLEQPLSEKFVLIAGKLDGTRFADKNAFANDERTQFLNAAFRNNPVVFPFAPYTSLSLFAVYMPTEWLTVAAGLMNTNDSVTRTGFDTGFHSPEGWTAAVEIDFNIKPFGLPGHQRFAYVYSNKDYDLLDQDVRVGGGLALTATQLILRRLGIIQTKTRPDDWTVYYNFDQYLYTEKADPKQGVGLFGRFGWTTGDANPFSAFYSIGLGGQGVIPQRDHDTFGLGYYYVDLSNDLASLLDVHSEQGVELFYNIEITPWLHVTPDLQVIVDPGGGDDDVAIVYGMRMQMSF